MSTVTKTILIKQMSKHLGLPKVDVEMIFDAFFETLRESFLAGKHVKLSGFGKFVLRDKKARSGRNPQTGEAAVIEARRVLTFQVGKKLRAELKAFSESRVEVYYDDEKDSGR